MIQTKRISTLLPNALAYFRCVARLGECLPEIKLFSNRAIAGAFVFMRFATSSCVKPASLRAFKTWSSSKNSSLLLSASYLALNSGFSNYCPTIFACVSSGIMYYFLYWSSCNSQFFKRCFRCFFNKTVQHNNSLANSGAIRHSRNALSAFKAQLKQTASHRLRMRLTQICPLFNHTLS